MALNLAEGMYSRGEVRTARYHTALGSMRETQSCLEVAGAFGYVRCLDDSFTADVNRIIGTLVRLVEGRPLARWNLYSSLVSANCAIDAVNSLGGRTYGLTRQY